jgi:hypothetical protein
MTGERSYVQVPPDSTGKKIRHEPFHRVGFKNRVGGHIWQVGERYTVGGATGIVFSGPNQDQGYIGFKADSSYDFANSNIPADADITYQGSVVATTNSDEILFIPYSQISGGSSPHNTVEVDQTGSMNIRFSEGNPQLDAFGKLRVALGTTLGDYIFSAGTLPNDFSSNIVGNATVGHLDGLGALRITCPGGTPGAGAVDSHLALDKVAHTTNTYHHYYPGFSQTAIMTVALDDEGKDGVSRNWGYFDAYNGYMFRVDDSTNGLKLIIRSNVTGNVVETEILSSDFNGDKVDGTGVSQMNLRLTDDNIYWIDIQWLGAGRVRFGTYHRGERVVIHEYYHESDLNAGKPHSRTGALPLCFVQFSDAFTTGSSEMYVWCAAVHTEHAVDIADQGRNRLETITKTFDPENIENGNSYELLGTLTPVQTIIDSTINHSLYLPNYMEAMAYHKNGDEALVEIEVYVNPVIGGGTMSLPINPIDAPSTPWLVPVASSDPTNAVEVFKSENYDAADRPKLWGGGLHVLASYGRGQIYQDVSSLYSDFQHGAFKNFSENGGTEDHPIASWNVGTETVFTTSMPQLVHREGNPIYLYGMDGTLGDELNYDNVRDNKYYIRITGLKTARLYTDIAFQNPVDTTGMTSTVAGRMRGDYGMQMYFVVVCKPLTPTVNKAKTLNDADPVNRPGDLTVHFNLGWSEVIQ